MIKILILILSLSLRTANLPDCPYDYEIEGGLRGSNNKITFMYERENERQYTGRNIILRKERLGFEFVDYVKSAKNIDYQRFLFFYPLNNFSLGMILGFEKWGNLDGLASMTFKNKYVKLLYARGEKQEIAELDLMYEHKLTERISLIPLAKYRRSGINEFWQCKVALNVRLK